MSESERDSYNIGMWAKPEAFCVICIFQGVALFFVWEAVCKSSIACCDIYDSAVLILYVSA